MTTKKKKEERKTESKKNLTERIIVDPQIKHGKPVIKGTRVPIDLVLGSLAGGMNKEEICREYDLEKEDIQAAIDYARRRVSGEEVTQLEA